MNATLFEGGKVHRLNGDTARCGVGKRHQRRHWQMDLDEVTCQRCIRVIEQPRNKDATVLTTDGH